MLPAAIFGLATDGFVARDTLVRPRARQDPPGNQLKNNLYAGFDVSSAYS